MTAAIGMKDEIERRILASQRHFEGFTNEIRINPVRKRVTNDFLSAEIFDNGEIEPTFNGSNVGDVTDPGNIRSWSLKALI